MLLCLAALRVSVEFPGAFNTLQSKSVSLEFNSISRQRLLAGSNLFRPFSPPHLYSGYGLIHMLVNVGDLKELTTVRRPILRYKPLRLVTIFCLFHSYEFAEAAPASPLAPDIFIKRLSCEAQDVPGISVVIHLKSITPYQYEITRLAYNKQGKIVLENGKGLPKVQSLYHDYILTKKPINKITLNALLGAWGIFGNTFRWGPTVYRCQVI